MHRTGVLTTVLSDAEGPQLDKEHNNIDGERSFVRRPRGRPGAREAAAVQRTAERVRRSVGTTGRVFDVRSLARGYTRGG